MAKGDKIKTPSGYGNLILGLLIVVLVIGGYFLLQPQYEKYKQNQESLKEKELLVDGQNKIYQDMQSLKKEYENLSTSVVKEMALFLPSEDDIEELMLQMQTLASENGVFMPDFSFASEMVDLTKFGTSPTTTTTASELKDFEESIGDEDVVIETKNKQSKLAVVTISTVATGSYDNFKLWLDAVEKNMRLIEIKTIDFNAASSGEGTDNIPGAYSYNLNLRTYFLTEENITKDSK